MEKFKNTRQKHFYRFSSQQNLNLNSIFQQNGWGFSVEEEFKPIRMKVSGNFNLTSWEFRPLSTIAWDTQNEAPEGKSSGDYAYVSLSN